MTFVERTSEVLANFSAGMIVHTHTGSYSAFSSDFHLFVQLKSNRNLNPTPNIWTSSLWHLLKNVCVPFNKDELELSLAAYV